ncbi:MAG TPA: hypothetical protein VHB72_00875 [Candidatus Saccharimonadales bacterium]|nr:hypothetical protein [Candidatus Saccharimonadales bacterium]
MRSIERGQALLATGMATAALFAGGCGGNSRTETVQAGPANPAMPKEVGKIVCHAIRAGKWRTAGNALQTGRVAEALGVTAQQVEHGKIGDAECNAPVSSDPVGAGEAVVVRVDGEKDILPEDCLVLGLHSGKHPPLPHHSYRGIIAACAAPEDLSATV